MSEDKEYLVVDLEMCEVDTAITRKAGFYSAHEIIEIGAAVINRKNKVTDEYKIYVKPHYGQLSGFISDLTGIIDMDISDAPELETALKRFLGWINKRPFTVLSWSDTDLIQLSEEMTQKNIYIPELDSLIDGWVDVQKSYDDYKGFKRSTSLERAMKLEGIVPEGRQHDGASDARNTAALVASLLKKGAGLSLEPVNQCLEYHDTEGSINSPFSGFGGGFFRDLEVR